jgi:large subunit ribosomal protein L21
MKVITTVVEHTKGRKILVFKYKAKEDYRRKTGHRQKYTRLQVESIGLE